MYISSVQCLVVHSARLQLEFMLCLVVRIVLPNKSCSGVNLQYVLFGNRGVGDNYVVGLFVVVVVCLLLFYFVFLLLLG